MSPPRGPCLPHAPTHLLLGRGYRKGVTEMGALTGRYRRLFDANGAPLPFLRSVDGAIYEEREGYPAPILRPTLRLVALAPGEATGGATALGVDPHSKAGHALRGNAKLQLICPIPIGPALDALGATATRWWPAGASRSAVVEALVRRQCRQQGVTIEEATAEVPAEGAPKKKKRRGA